MVPSARVRPLCAILANKNPVQFPEKPNNKKPAACASPVHRKKQKTPPPERHWCHRFCDAHRNRLRSSTATAFAGHYCSYAHLHRTPGIIYRVTRRTHLLLHRRSSHASLKPCSPAHEVFSRRICCRVSSSCEQKLKFNAAALAARGGPHQERRPALPFASRLARGRAASLKVGGPERPLILMPPGRQQPA